MSTQIPDLWPDDIAVPNDRKAPVTILRQQAALLGEKTQNLIEAAVHSSVDSGEDFMEHYFSLVAPALGNYRFRLFSIKHGISFYPIDIIYFTGESRQSLQTEESLLSELRIFFASSKVKEVLQALIAQSQA